MSKKRVADLNSDKLTDFSFYLLVGGLAFAFLLIIVFVLMNL